MLSANEARQATEKVIESETSKALSEIEEAIADGINNGSFSVTLNHDISDEIKHILELKGYNVKKNVQYNEPYTTISW